MRNFALLSGALTLAGCFGSDPPATCAADDVDCFADHLAFVDASGNRVSIARVDTTTIEAISAATATSASTPQFTYGPVSISYPYGTLIDGADVIFTFALDLSFTDPNGCQPVLAVNLRSNGVRSKHTGCFPGIHDMKKVGTLLSNVGFTAAAAAETSMSLEVTAISSTDCTSIDDPAALLKAPGVVANNPHAFPLTIAPQPSNGSGSGSGTCPGGLLVSTLECDPIGSGGVASYCLTAAEYTGATGLPLPATCAPAGTTGCENSSGTLVNPCCPGLRCEVTAACGDASGATGGTCK